MNDESKLSRRALLDDALAPAVMFGMGGAACGALPGSQGPTGQARIRLAEAGPMIPPVPAILLSVKGLPGEPDELSVVWTFIIEGQPPQVGISVHVDHRARGLLAKHGEFVLNVPSATFMRGFDRVDMNSSKTSDKFALSGLTRGQALEVDAPTVKEAPIQCECRVFKSIDVPPKRTLFLAEVLVTTVLDGVCDSAGRLMVDRVPFFGMTAGSGEFYTMGDLVGNIGKSVGRTDIKY